MSYRDHPGEGEVLDKVIRLVNKAAAAEIRRLRKVIKDNGDEGRDLCHKHGGFLGDLPHEIYDFFQAL